MAFNTRCKFYDGLLGRKTHSTLFPTSLSLEKKGRKKKTVVFAMSSAAAYNAR